MTIEVSAIHVEGVPTTPSFSPAYVVGDLVFTSGQVGIDAATGAVPESFAEEVRHMFRNLETVLRECGSSPKNVVKTTCFLTDFSHLAEFNEMYNSFFPSPRPARSAVQTGLVGKFRVEIEVIAVKP